MFFHSHTVFLYRSPFFVSRFLSLSIFIYICVFECALLTVILVCTVHSLVQHFLCAYLIVWRVTKRTLDKHTNMWTKDRIHSTLSLFLLVLWELFVHLVYYNELHFLLKWISSGFFFRFCFIFFFPSCSNFYTLAGVSVSILLCIQSYVRAHGVTMTFRSMTKSRFNDVQMV